MWLFNVTREIFRRAGRTVLPDKIPQMDQQMFELARRKAWTDTDPNRVWVLKVHSVLAPTLPKSRVITSMRDPRDVLVSFRHFMKTTFDDAMGVIEEHVVRFSDAYRNHSPELLLWTDYQNIEERPADVIRRVAEFLGIRITPQDIAETVETFSREKVRQLIENTNRSVFQRIKEQAPIDRGEVVLLGQNNIRAFDINTGFQTGHVSRDRGGGWRTYLSDEEKQIIHERIGDWIAQWGFPLE